MWDSLSDLISTPTVGRGSFHFLCAVLVGIAFGVIAAKLDHVEWAPHAAVVGFFLYAGMAFLYAKTHHRRFRRRRFR